MEWSLQMLPSEFDLGRYLTSSVDNLQAELRAARPLAAAHVLELLVFDEAKEIEDGDSSGVRAAPSAAQEPRGRITLVWSVRNLPIPVTDEPPTQAAAPAAKHPADAVADALGQSRRNLERLRSLPVTVSVRLAEKKIEISQLMGLSSGALITFNKPCEDLLDMFVNNCLCFRGEAVKIGEKFGLKIDEVGVRETREEKVINA
jgi:flagellar motor switch protein FliN/FliY